MNILELDNSWNGLVPVGAGQRPPNWDAQRAKALSLIENHKGLSHRVWKYRMEEAMTTDSFPLLFADSLNRELLNAFASIGTPLAPLFHKKMMSDFKTDKMFRTEGMTKRLQKVLEKGEYLAREEGEEKVDITLEKYGAQCDFSWEAYLGDDLGAFQRFPKSLADSAVNTEAWLQTSIYIGATGPIAATFVDAADGAAAILALPLTIANLETAIETMGEYTSSGEPIISSPTYLVVPPALRITAQNILTSVEKAWTAGGAAAAVDHATANTVRNGISLIVDPWIPVIATTGTVGQTCWFLATKPSDIPSAAFGKLVGNEAPALFMKSSDAVRVGGGVVSPYEGDFATDNIFYKVRHCMAAVALEPRGLIGSWGQADPT
jgi:hypothetical protein